MIASIQLITLRHLGFMLPNMILPPSVSGVALTHICAWKEAELVLVVSNLWSSTLADTPASETQSPAAHPAHLRETNVTSTKSLP